MRKTMELICIRDKNSFDQFVESQPSIHYSKLWFWGEFESGHNYKTEYWRFVDGGKTVATAVLLKKRTLFGMTWYIPNGPSLDYFDEGLLKQVLEVIKHKADQAGVLYVRIDSNIPRRPHNQKGDVVEGFNNEFLTDRFASAGFQHTGYQYGYSGYLFSRFTYVLDLSPDFTELVDQTAPNVRNLYRKNLRRGVQVRDGNRDELKYLVVYGRELADKLEFKPKLLRFFQQLFDDAQEHAVYRVVTADLNLAMRTIEAETETLHDSIKKIETNPKKAGFVKEVKRQIEDLDKEASDLNTLIQTKGSSIVLGSALYLLAGERSYNVYTYTNKDFPSFHATISLHMETIKELKERGIRHYDFVGISGSLDPQDQYYGLYDFKRKFGGEFIENLGEFYYKPNPRLAYIEHRFSVYQGIIRRRFYHGVQHLKAKLHLK
jgi:peptidoglycan pentaglycine glycine transferase (the first glycine)